MRPELYADSRDVWKWTVAAREALQGPRAIRWVSMFRPNRQEHGEGRELVPSACPVVEAFFEAERNHIVQNGIPDINSISVSLSRLCSSLKVQFEANTLPYAVSVNRRLEYVRDESSFLATRPKLRRDVIFVDPDNGIGRAATYPRAGMQLHEDHVPLLWRALRKDDILAIVQFQWNEPNWVNTRQTNLARILGISASQIRAYPWSNVCIFAVTA